MQSTQRVEGYNGIIKRVTNAKAGLVDIFYTLQARLQAEQVRSDQKTWMDQLPVVEAEHVSQGIFPSIDKCWKISSHLQYLKNKDVKCDVVCFIMQI